MDFLSFLGFALLVGIAVAFVGGTVNAQKRQEERITAVMAQTLDTLTATLFDAAPRKASSKRFARAGSNRRTLSTVALEGTVKGNAMQVAACTSPVNSVHALTGFVNAVIELSVTVGLKGATPRFAVSSKPGKHVGGAREHVREDDFAAAFTIEGEPSLVAEVFDDGLRAELFRFAGGARVVSGRPGLADPPAVAIDVTPDGLTLRWFADSVAVEQKETERPAEERAAAIAAETKRTQDAAAIVRTMEERLLQAIDRQTARVRVHGDADAYRVAAEREVASTDQSDAEDASEPAKRLEVR